jgi:hypothetical protein
MIEARRWLAAGLALGALTPALACDPARPLRQDLRQAALLQVARALADSSGCRVVLAPEVAAQATRIDWSSGARVADALDGIAAAHELNWSMAGDGSIEIVPRGAPPPQSHQSGALVIEADAADATPVFGLIERLRLPSERSPIVPRTVIAPERVRDDAMGDYATAIMRAPGVYTMASGDAIRGIASSRLAPSQRSSLLSIDGIPMPSELWLFNRPGLSLMQSLDIARSGTGLANAYAAGAGDVSIATRAPATRWHGEFGYADAPALAPRAQLSLTGSLGVPGLATALGVSRQLEAESFRREPQPDIAAQRQTSARFEWRGEDGRHLLFGSFLDIAQRDIGGATVAGSGCSPSCSVGAELAARGGLLGWQFQATPRLRLSASAGLSDSRSRIGRLDLFDAPVFGQPVLLRFRHADLRADVVPASAWSFSAGLGHAQRERRSFSRSTLDLSDGASSSMGVFGGDGAAALAYTSAQSRLTDLPQAYAEVRHDDGGALAAHLGLRWIFNESSSTVVPRDIDEFNCSVQPGRFPPEVRTCSDVVRARVGSNNQLNGDKRDFALPSASVQYRRSDAEWWAVQYRESLIASDYFARSFNPDGVMERLRSTELGWHRDFGEVELEARLFHQDLRDRFASLSAPGVPSLQTFDSEIDGVELELASRPDDELELWSSATALDARSNLVVAAGERARVNGASPWTFGVGGRWHFARGGYLGGHFSHAAAAWFANSAARFDRLPARDLLDLRIGWRNRHVDVSLWGSNLLDDDYFIETSGVRANAALSPYHAYDRLVGIDLRVGF